MYIQNPTELVIILVTVALSTLFIILGIQLYFILKEVRQSIRKVNKMLDDGGRVTGTVGDSVENLSGFVQGVKSGLSAIASLKGKD
jgi:hypothetical protein